MNQDLLTHLGAEVQLWRQGDVFQVAFGLRLVSGDAPLDELAASLGPGLHPVQEATDLGVALVTQTCEIIRFSFEKADRLTVQIAPVVQLAGGALKLAQSGRAPRLAALPGLGHDYFADLDRCTTVDKTALLDVARVRGCPSSGDVARFGLALARHRGRFAFPADVDGSLGKLKQRVVEKSPKDSPEGRLLRDALIEIRADTDRGWESDEPYSLRLYFIVRSEFLPPLDPEDDPVDEEFSERCSASKTEGEMAALVEQLLAEGRPPQELDAAWQRLVQMWCDRAEPMGLVGEVSGNAEAESDAPLRLIYDTQRLDLDHLSSDEDLPPGHPTD